MMMGRYVLIAALFAVLTGCATSSVPMSSHDGDAGYIRQRTEFKDLPAEEQQAIMHGG